VNDDELNLLAQTLAKTMTTVTSGAALHDALTGLGWQEMLAQTPDAAVPLVFRLLGETGAHAPVLTDVVAPGNPGIALPYAGNGAVRWIRSGDKDVNFGLRLAPADAADPLTATALAAGRRALGWWLLGSGRAMLKLARAHALDRAQFGKPIASFQAVRHKLAETYVALEGAEAVLSAAGSGELSSLLAKAAAGKAALLASKHCQQVHGGIGYTEEHSLHLHVKRVLVLDGLLGSTRELTREAGRHVIAAGAAPRLVNL
jgi:alkylation response protein AidB-like acyl-CoA dehydrogenase